MKIQFVDSKTGYGLEQNGLLLQTLDGGLTWNELNIGANASLYGMSFANPMNGFVVGDNLILATTDGGKSWNPQETDVADNYKDVAIDDSGDVVIMGDTSLSTTFVPIPLYTPTVDNFSNNDPLQVSKNTAEEAELQQNFPNPFTEETTISVSLKRETRISLVVRDVLGRNVKTLLDDIRPEGTTHILFSGSGLTNGTYFYHLTTPNGSTLKRMMLLK